MKIWDCYLNPTREQTKDGSCYYFYIGNSQYCLISKRLVTNFKDNGENKLAIGTGDILDNVQVLRVGLNDDQNEEAKKVLKLDEILSDDYMKKAYDQSVKVGIKLEKCDIDNINDINMLSKSVGTGQGYLTVTNPNSFFSKLTRDFKPIKIKCRLKSKNRKQRQK